jgi:hypothetical protein
LTRRESGCTRQTTDEENTVAYGSLQVTDTLQSLRVASGTIAQFGEDRAWDAINAALVAHNRILADLVEPFVEVTTNRLRRYGGPDQVNMEEIDEFGNAQAQKVSAGAFIGFPMRKYGVALQWDRTYFAVALASEFAAQVTAVFAGDLRLLQRDIKRSLFTATNYTYVDRYVDRASIPVKAAVNADGQPIPLGPNGEVFNASTHTHYIAAGTAWNGGATSTQEAADVLALVTTVIEHFNGGDLYINCNQAQEAAFRAMSQADFTPYLDARVIGPTSNYNAPGVGLNPVTIYNRPIGLFHGAEVWVKPWVPSGYMCCYMAGQPKPLAMRMRGSGPEASEGKPMSIFGNPQGNVAVAGPGDLMLIYENEQYPLRAREWAREFGVSFWNRINFAALYVNGTSYVSPTIN